MKVFGGVKVTMKALLFLSLAAALFVNNGVNGFIGIHRNSYRKSVLVNTVVRSNVDYLSLSSTSPSDGSNRKCAKMISHSNKQSIFVKRSLNAFISFFVAIGMVPSAFAVSGGGLDYANLDLSGKDFSNGNYKGKDFTQVIAKGTTFENSNLLGCRFYKAYLVNTNFKNADLRGASLEDTSMDGAILDNANAAGAYFSASLLDVKSMAGADFTDAQLPPKLLERVCAKENFATGTNSKTGVETRESLMCPE